jgi:anhydro-N-acetylmuramic acid kinase
MRFSELSRKKELKIIGIMNGTSLDGVDYVLCKVKRKGARAEIQYLDHASGSFRLDLKSLLQRAVAHELNVAEVAELHHELGRLYVEHLRTIVKNRKWKFHAIGLHGQTIFHAPPEATLQIGEPSYLSAEFKVPVIADFRVADLAHGGQGAPIASLFHQWVFQKQFPKKTLSLHNLGGISNLTLLDQKGKVLRAFDTGPANMLLDLYISKVSRGEQTYDAEGKFAARGIPLQKVIDESLQSEEYFLRQPPKSCGREQFGENFLVDLELKMGAIFPQDKMATLTELTARSISEAYLKLCPKQPDVVILCGGGAKNKYLKKRIQYHLPYAEILSSQELQWPVTAIEGGAFALLAACRLWNLPSNLPETTGAKKAVAMGKIVEAF